MEKVELISVFYFWYLFIIVELSLYSQLYMYLAHNYTYGKVLINITQSSR